MTKHLYRRPRITAPAVLLMVGCALAAVVVLLWAPSIYANTAELSLEHGQYVEPQIDLFLQINQYLSDRPTFWRNITELGDALVYFAFLSVLFKRWPRLWAALLGAIPLTGILSSVGKSMFAMPRPAAVLPHDQFEIVGRALTGYTSLPSGHTMTAFAISTVVIVFFINVYRSKYSVVLVSLVALLVAVLVGVSRVAVGAHWPADVVIGALLGVAGGLSGIVQMRVFANWWSWIQSSAAQLGFGLFFVVMCIALISQTLAKNDSTLVLPWLAALCAMIAGVYLIATQIKTKFFKTAINSKN